MNTELEEVKEIDLAKENKKLTRKIKALEESMVQFENIKKKYDNLIIELNHRT